MNGGRQVKGEWRGLNWVPQRPISSQHPPGMGPQRTNLGDCQKYPEEKP